MIISAWPIKKPRISRMCLMCGKMILHGPQIRLYGAAHRTDPPYVMYTHPRCVDATGQPKIIKALEELFK